MTAHLSCVTGHTGRPTEPCLVFMSAWTFEVIIQQLHVVAFIFWAGVKTPSIKMFNYMIMLQN